MVKLIGPCHSTTASGTLAAILNFRKAKRGHNARKKPQPKDPRTVPQQATRTMFTYLTQTWSLLSTADRSTWTNIFPNKKQSAYLNYLQYNLDRWTRFRFPSQTFPATENGSLPAVFAFMASTQIYYITTTNFFPTGKADCCAIAVFRSPTGSFTPQRNLTVTVYPTKPISLWYQKLHPPRPGTYFYNAVSFTKQGNFKTNDYGETSAAVQ